MTQNKTRYLAFFGAVVLALIVFAVNRYGYFIVGFNIVAGMVIFGIAAVGSLAFAILFLVSVFKSKTNGLYSSLVCVIFLMLLYVFVVASLFSSGYEVQSISK